MGNFHVKTQKSTDFAHTFLKNYIFLYSLMKIILFTLKIYLFGSKIAFKAFFTTKDAKSFGKIIFSNIFTFLSVIRQNFEYNLRILANFGKFSCKNSKIYGFRPYVFKKLHFFVLFNEDYTFYTKNLFIRLKNCFQSILYKERYKKFCKNQFFSNIFTFLSVTLQNLEYNLRILANFGKFSRKNSEIYGFRPYVLKKTFFFVYFNEDYIFYNKNLFSQPKIGFKAFFAMKDAKSFVKINFLVTFLHF